LNFECAEFSSDAAKHSIFLETKNSVLPRPQPLRIDSIALSSLPCLLIHAFSEPSHAFIAPALHCAIAFARPSNLLLNILIASKTTDRVLSIAATGVGVAEACILVHDLRLDLDRRSLLLGDATSLDAYF